MTIQKITVYIWKMTVSKIILHTSPFTKITWSISFVFNMMFYVNTDNKCINIEHMQNPEFNLPLSLSI